MYSLSLDSCWTFFPLKAVLQNRRGMCLCNRGQQFFRWKNARNWKWKILYIRTYTYVYVLVLHSCNAYILFKSLSSIRVQYFSVGLRLLRDLVLKCFYKILSTHLKSSRNANPIVVGLGHNWIYIFFCHTFFSIFT